MPPQAIGDAGRGRRRHTHAVEIAFEDIRNRERAIRRSTHVGIDAAYRIAAAEWMAG